MCAVLDGQPKQDTFLLYKWGAKDQRAQILRLAPQPQEPNEVNLNLISAGVAGLASSMDLLIRIRLGLCTRLEGWSQGILNLRSRSPKVGPLAI